MSDEDSTVEFEQVNSKPRLDSAVTVESNCGTDVILRIYEFTEIQ